MSVTISNDVVATIAGIAASEVAGISGMFGGMTEGVVKRLTGKQVQKGVSVEVGTQEAAIDLRVIVDYGTNIPKVCTELQEKVKEAVETMTGLTVVEVNVKVEAVTIKGEEPEVEAARVK